MVHRKRHRPAHGSFQQSVQHQAHSHARADRRIIFANGDSVQVIQISPWMGALLMLLLVGGMIAIIASASYLFFRDELFTASLKRQHQIQVAYEDRVTELRREIDRITSRQLLNQQAYEARVERLLGEHLDVYQQGVRVSDILSRAGQLGIMPRPTPPSPIVPPDQEASLPPLPPDSLSSSLTDNPTDRMDDTSAARPNASSIDPHLTGNSITGSIVTGSIPQLPTQRGLSVMDQAVINPSSLLTALDESLDTTVHNQRAALAAVAEHAETKIDSIAREMNDLNIRLTLPDVARLRDIGATHALALQADGVGGPLLEPRDGLSGFDIEAEHAERVMEGLSEARAALDAVPVVAPARGARLSSRFGNRRDPFTRRTAFHAGIDYAAPTGTPVYAPADGVVTRASRAGGYGLMVELDHAHGLTTRFAHLSRSLVSPGAQVRQGDVIGRIGSTGRSTGPHLHYEVRRGSRAIDPLPFVRAGQRLADL
ncbi:MAG: M23 family metallopeptidase [Pseudomonadota bacterium]